jgi:ribosome biogenesis ATPase
MEFLVPRPLIRYRDLGGMESVVPVVRQLVELPLLHPEIYCHLGISPPRGLLLHGPSGSGKSLLVEALAGELDVPYLKVGSPEIVGATSGESEAKIRDIFACAAALARTAGGCLLFFDEIDAIAPKRDGTLRGMERRMVAQLLTCMDRLGVLGQSPVSHPRESAEADSNPVLKAAHGPPGGTECSNQVAGHDALNLANTGLRMDVNRRGRASDACCEGDDSGNNSLDIQVPQMPVGTPPVIVLGATSRPDALDSGLRRAGRFDREVCIPVPDDAARENILRVLARDVRIDGGCKSGESESDVGLREFPISVQYCD